MIPKVIEVVVKPFLFDVLVKIDSIVEEEWNDENVSLGKKMTANLSDSEGPMVRLKGKKPRHDDTSERNEKVWIGSLLENILQGKLTQQIWEMVSGGKVNLELSEDDLLSSQEPAEFSKSVGVNIQDSQ